MEKKMLGLKWNKKREESLKKKFFDKNIVYGYGVSCVFIQLSKKIGAKLYFDINYNRINHDEN